MSLKWRWRWGLPRYWLTDKLSVPAVVTICSPFASVQELDFDALEQLQSARLKFRKSLAIQDSRLWQCLSQFAFAEPAESKVMFCNLLLADLQQ